jgi:hypothetical protein
MELRHDVCVRISLMYPTCPLDMVDAVDEMLFRNAATYEEYAEAATLHERVMWYVKIKDYPARLREFGTPYACGFFHDDTAYVDHVKARYVFPYDPELLRERHAFALGFVEAYHGTAEEAGLMWFAWVKAALFVWH